MVGVLNCPYMLSRTAAYSIDFERKTPCVPGNSFCRSFAKVSTIALPQPSFSCFATIDLPMSQYKFINSLFTDLRASYWALCMRSFISLKNVLYSAVIMTDISLLSLPQLQSPLASGRRVYRQAGQFVFPNHGLWLVYHGFASNPRHSL